MILRKGHDLKRTQYVGWLMGVERKGFESNLFAGVGITLSDRKGGKGVNMIHVEVKIHALSMCGLSFVHLCACVGAWPRS